MSYFPYGSIEQEILDNTQYEQRRKNASNLEVVKALIEVLEFFASKVVERDGKEQ